MKSLLKAKVDDIMPTDNKEKGSLQDNREGPPPAKKCKLFRFMAQSTSSELPSLRSPLCISPSASSQVESYLSLPTTGDGSDPILFWQKNKSTFPQLTILALRYLCIQASSPPFERMFSVAGKVFRPEKYRMTDARFEEFNVYQV